MKRIVQVLLLAIAATTLAFGQSAGSDEKLIIQMEKDWAIALVKGDAAAVDKIVAPEYVQTDFTGSIVGRAQLLADMKSGDLKFASFTVDELKVVVFGDTALAFGVDTEKSTYKGKDISGQYRWTDVFAKQKGKWSAVTTHSSLLPKK